MIIEARPSEAPHDTKLLPLGIALALGLVTRVSFVDSQSLTMDEVTELGIAKGSIYEILQTVDGFPPLYHLLLHGWLQTFGADAAARWVSVVLGLLAILCVWKLAKILVGPRAAGWAVVLFSILPFHIWYSQEARAYSLYIFLAALALWLFFRARDTNRWADWGWFVAAGTAGMYAHYFFAVLLGTLALCLLAEGRHGRPVRRGWASLAVIAALCLPELLLLRMDLTFQTSPHAAKPSFGPTALGYTFFSFVSGYTIGPSMRELHTIGAAEALRDLIPWLLIVGLAVGYSSWSVLRYRETEVELRALLILCAAPVILLGALTALAGVGYNVRYASWVVIPVVVWIGAGLAWSMNRWQGKATLALLVMLFALARWNRVAVDRYREEDSRAVATFLQQQAPSRRLLVTVDYMASPLGYYLGSERVERVSRVWSADDGLDEAVFEIRAAERDEADVWLAYSRPFHGDPTGLLLERLQTAATRHESFAGIDLFLVDRGRL